VDRGEVGPAASGTPDLADERLTEAVLTSFDGSRSPRLKEVMQSLTRHLHAFVSEVELTEEEWFLAIDFLARTGHMSDYRRQEFILLSDTLGVSMLVVGLNNRKPPGATQATVFGPFFVEGAPFFENGDDLANGAPGEPCFVEGQVRSLSGEPIGGAHLAVWQADENGFYDVQYEGLSGARGRGQLRADGEGRFHFRTVRPEPYPIPGDGPVGEMMERAGRSLMRPAHIHFMVSAPGYESVTTHVFEAGGEYLDSDAVFGVKETLIADFVRHEPGTAPDGTGMDVPYYTVCYDFVLTPSRESGDPQGARTHEQAWEGWQDGRSGKGRDDARG
jgi:hydroxyquinol 1,2-dioxygenase